MASFVDLQIQYLREHLSLENIIILDTNYATPRIFPDGYFRGDYARIEHLPPSQIEKVYRLTRKWYNYLTFVVENADFFIVPPFIAAEMERHERYLSDRVREVTNKKLNVRLLPVSRVEGREKQSNSPAEVSKKYKRVIRMLTHAQSSVSNAREYGLGNSTVLYDRDGPIYNYLCSIADYWTNQRELSRGRYGTTSVADAMTIAFSLLASTLKKKKVQIFTMDVDYPYLLRHMFGDSVIRNRPETESLWQMRDAIPGWIMDRLRNCDVTVYYLHPKMPHEGASPHADSLGTSYLRGIARGMLP